MKLFLLILFCPLLVMAQGDVFDAIVYQASIKQAGGGGGGGSPIVQWASTNNTQTATPSAKITFTNSVTSNNRVVVMVSNENVNTHPTSVTVASGPAITFTKRCQSGTASTTGSCDIYDGTPASSGALSITVTMGGNMHFSAAAVEISGVETTPGGATNQLTGLTMCTNVLTTTRSSSVIVSCGSDWNANQASRSYKSPSGLTSNTELDYDPQNTVYTGLYFASIVTTAQSYGIGSTAPTSVNGWTVCSYEVRTP